MKNLLTLGLLLVLSLPAIGQGSVRRADTLLQVLTINPTNIATADKLMYLTAGRNTVTDGEVLFVDWDRTNALATNATSRFATLAGVGRWVVRPTLLNLTNAFQFLAGSNMTVAVTSNSVTYSSTGGGGTNLPILIVDGLAVTNGLLQSGVIYGSDISWAIASDGTNVIGSLHNGSVTFPKMTQINSGVLLGGEAGSSQVPVSEIQIGANLQMIGDTLSAIVPASTNSWQIEVGGVLTIEPDLVDTSRIDVTASGSSVSFDLVSGSVTTNYLSTGVNSLLHAHNLSFTVNGTDVVDPNLLNSSEITASVSASTNVSLSLATGSVALNKLVSIGASQLIGRGTSGTGAAEPVTVGTGLVLGTNGILSATGTNSTVVRVGGTTVTDPNFLDTSEVDFSIDLATNISASLFNNSVVFSKLQQIATSRLLGRSTAGSGDIEQILIGSGLSLTSGTLSATGGGGSESTTASNLDTQSATNQGWFKALSGSDLQFRNFAVGPNLTLRSNANSVTLDVVLSTNSGTVVSVDGGSSLSLINFADNTRIAGTLTTTNMTYDLVPGTITSNYLSSSSVTQDKLSAIGTPTSTNFLAGDWTYKQVTTNMIPGLVAALESLRMSLTFTNGVTNSAGVIHGNYVAGANVTLTTNNGQVSIAAAAGGTTYTFTNGVTNVSGVVHGNLAAGANITLSTNAGQVTIASTGGGTITVSTNNLGFLARSAVIVTNTETSGELTHGTFAIPANTLGVDGDEVEIHMSGQWNPYTSGGPNGYICRFVYDDDAGAELIVSTYGTNAFPSTSSTLSPDWVFRIKRVSSTTAFISMVHSVGNQYNESNSTNIVNDTRVRAIALQGSDTFDDDTVTFSVTLTMFDGSRVATMKTFGYIMSKVGSGSGSGGGGDPGIQVANSVYAGPTNGSPATPAFRALVDADVPSTIPRLADSQTFTATNTFSGPTWIKPNRKRVVLFEKEWLGLNSSAIGYPEFNGTAVASGTGTIITGETNHPGMIRLSSSSSANSGYYFLSSISGLFAEPLLTWESVSRVRATNAGISKTFGFTDSANTANPTDAIRMWRSNNFLIPQIWNNGSLVQGYEYPVSSNQFVYIKLQVQTNMTDVSFYAEDSDTKTLILSTNLTGTLPASANRVFGAGHFGFFTNAVAVGIEDLDWSTAYIDTPVNR